ncbi:hypothetical protein PN456_04905, partial [Nodularia spumigena CS-586/05]|uniref:hypothetical protein n=1 Tax=Nodularia spumigena TaxID=70799 RepID=UPI00232FB897
GNREQFQELDRSDFSFESNLNARFLSSHSLKACTFSISNSLKSFTCKVCVFIQPPLFIYVNDLSCLLYLGKIKLKIISQSENFYN